jgi:hypothetical protein
VKIVERCLGNRDERNQNHGYETVPPGVGRYLCVPRLPPRLRVSLLGRLEFVFELCSLAEACIGEFRSPDWGQSRKLLAACGPVGGMTPPVDCTEFSVGTVENLRENSESVAMELLRSIFISLDWNGL